MRRLDLAFLAITPLGLLLMAACSPQQQSLVSTGCTFLPILAASTEALDENTEAAIAAGCTVYAATIAAQQLQQQAVADQLEAGQPVLVELEGERVVLLQ